MHERFVKGCVDAAVLLVFFVALAIDPWVPCMLHSSLSTVEFCLQTQGFTFIVHSLYSEGPGFESLILVPIFVVSN